MTLMHGDAVELLRHLEPNTIDASICDPPYSSGGFTRGDRNQDPATKYQQTGTTRQYATFSGDNRDAHSYAYWTHLWMRAAYMATKPAGYMLCFTDWRQLPITADALQAAGFVWRGIVTWDKGQAARAPHKGYFRHQCEFLVWGTKGISAVASHAGPFPGCYQIPVLQKDKHHVTGKPTRLMQELVKVVPPGGLILDPFMGSGTTGVACQLKRREFVGIEQDAHWFDVATARIAAVETPAAA